MTTQWNIDQAKPISMLMHSVDVHVNWTANTVAGRSLLKLARGLKLEGMLMVSN